MDEGYQEGQNTPISLELISGYYSSLGPDAKPRGVAEERALLAAEATDASGGREIGESASTQLRTSFG